MLDLARPVQLRDGTPAQILATDLEKPFSILCVLTRPNGRKFVMQFAPNGHSNDPRLGFYHTGEDPNDLVNVLGSKVTRYLKIYWDSVEEVYCTYGALETNPLGLRRDLHMQSRLGDACACIRVEFSEGQCDT